MDTANTIASPVDVLSSDLHPDLKPEWDEQRFLKFACWVLLIAAGLVQGWNSRHRVFTDGISYLGIARYYVAGDWHAALSSYWSPLYSWILALWMLILRPSAYWEASLLHLTNFVAYVASLIAFEQLLTGLFKLQNRLIGDGGLSERTIRLAGYCAFAISTISFVEVSSISPDMVATAIGLFLTIQLLRIESREATRSTYIWFGVLLGLEFLARSAFAVFVPLYLLIAAALRFGRTRRLTSLKPVTLSAAMAVIVVAPFLTALTISKGRFTLGDAGRLNYGWEIDGAPRFFHWQGQPGDIGTPAHPTHRVFEHPDVYTFDSKIPGTYPPWFDPSYWYAGISPHLKLEAQLYVWMRGLKSAAYLFIQSPVGIPAVILISFMGWLQWFSKRGIFGYWFLMVPSLAYIGIYTLIYLDPRYVALNFLVVWMCILASISVRKGMRKVSNRGLELATLIAAVVFYDANVQYPLRRTMADIYFRSERERNINAMIAERMKQVGVRAGDRIAWIGEAFNGEWARLDGAKIVAEVPESLVRREDLVFRWAVPNKTEVRLFWSAPAATRAHILDIFRKEGAKFVVADGIPDGVDSTGWTRVVPDNTPGIPWTGVQLQSYGIVYMRLTSN